jgi:hypothetical protein
MVGAIDHAESSHAKRVSPELDSAEISTPKDGLFSTILCKERWEKHQNIVHSTPPLAHNIYIPIPPIYLSLQK